MRRLNGAADRVQIGLRQRPPRVRRRQHVMQMLAQLPGLVGNARTCGVRELAQAPGKGWLDRRFQLSKPDEVGIGGQVLNRLWKGTLIQGVDEIERGMPSTPVERSSTVSLVMGRLVSAASTLRRN